MSFYGNIQNRLNKFFRFIKVGDLRLDATQENDVFTLKANENDNISITLNEENKEVIFNVPKIEISEANNASDNKLIYSFQYSNNEDIGQLEIPYAIVLQSGEIVDKNAEGTSGIFLKLTLKTESGTQDVYIDVKSLVETSVDYGYDESSSTVSLTIS